MRVRIATLNVAGTKDGWFEDRRGVLIAGMKAERPDVACLQETTVSRGSSVYDQAQDIGEAVGLPIVAFAPYGNPIEVMSPEQGGIAILSRWPILRVRNRRLPAAHESPPDARVALFVTLEAPGGELRVVNTHLSWEPEGAQMRLMQAGLILDDLVHGRDLEAGAKTVVAGDFNAVETEPAMHLARGFLLDTFRKRHPNVPGYTWLTANPLTGKLPIANRRLDYVLCAPGIHIHSSHIILDNGLTSHRHVGHDDSLTNARFASDHFGVLAELEWPEKQVSDHPERQKGAA